MRTNKVLNSKQQKARAIEEQVGKALKDKQAFADELFACPHCGSHDVMIDFVSDKDDYLCSCENCNEDWAYSKERFDYLTRRQNRVLSKAKRYWQWHNGTTKQRLSIVMDYAVNVIGVLVFVAFIVALCLSSRGSV